jgi:general secretion pathway protein J
MSARRPDFTKQQGFTLIEVLVAMALFAVLGVLGYRSLDSVRQSGEHVKGVATRWQDIARAVDRVGRDVRQAVMRNGRLPDGSSAPAWMAKSEIDDTAGSAQLVFSRLGGAESDTRRLAYRWRNGQLDLLLWSSPESTLPPTAYPLLDKVRRAEFAYLDAGNLWRERWPQEGGERLPRALRLRLELEEGGVLERIFDLPSEGS